MAIQLVSGNLNQFGDQGRFETDPSTWGFSLSTYGDLYRAPVSFEGNFGQMFEAKSNFVFGQIEVSKASILGATPGKKYVVRAKVWIDADAPIAPGDCEFSFEEPIAIFLSSETRRTVTEASGRDEYEPGFYNPIWVEVEALFTMSQFRLDVYGNQLTLYLYQKNIANNVTLNNRVWVDKLEVFEYIDVVACTIGINATNAPSNPSIVTNETLPGYNNGQIEVMVAGAVGAVEYRIRTLFGAFGAWQSSNIFSALPPGTYVVEAREVATTTCNTTRSFEVAAGSSTFIIDTAVTHETGLGLNDGTITITATGSGGYEYSKDNGATYQSGNVFNALAPGTYPILVRDVFGATVGRNVTVNAFSYAFDFTLTPTAETSPGANDGAIAVAVTGTVAPFTYSFNGGATYQAGNTLGSLSPGVYTVVVKDANNINRSKTVTVNAGTFNFDFTVDKTDETILGANNGTITVNTTGTSSPFTYSKDNGATYQSGNTFNALAPATYIVKVKDVANVVRQVSVTILPGIVVFEKVWFSENFITKGMAAASNWQSLVNYKLFDDVRVEEVPESGVFTSKLKVAISPDSTGNVLFQVREALRKIMEPVAPAFNSNTIVRLTDRIRFFKHFTGATTEVQEEPVTLNDSLPNLALWGGIDKFNYPGIDFFGTYATHKKFMSWAPLVKQVDPNQEDYLTFWMYSLTVGTLRLKIKAYFDDNTNQTATAMSLSGITYGRLYQIPAGPLNSGAKLVNAEKNLIKYELWLADQSDVAISEVRTYVLDAFSIPNVRYFMFLNSLGSFEVMRFYGTSEINSEFNREVVIKYLAPNYAAVNGEKKANRALRTQKENYSSGYFTGALAKEWQNYMNDFMLSTQVYEIINTARRPVVITGGSIRTEDKDYKRFFRFECEDAYDNNLYTPL